MEAAAMSQEAIEPAAEQTPSQEIDNALQNEGQEAAQEVEQTEEQIAEAAEAKRLEDIRVMKAQTPVWVQKKIDVAKARQREAENLSRELQDRMQWMEQQQRQPAQQKAEGEPRIEHFENIEDYVSAKAAFVADQRIQHTITTRERAESENRAQAAQKQSADNWNKRVQLATAEMPDFEDVVASSDIRFNEPAVLQAIQESDIGPKIAYYLASNPDEADEIAQMRGSSAIRAIGRIEAKLELGKASMTKAPPPIEPTGTKAKAVKSPGEMSDSEFDSWRKRHIAAR